MCSLIAGVVCSDGTMSADEREFLKRVMVQCGLPTDTALMPTYREDAAAELAELPAAVREQTLELVILAAAVDGRIVQIALLNGAKATADFSLLMVKRLLHTGSTLRARPIEFKAALADELYREVWPLLAERKVAPVMDMIYPLHEAWRAHHRMEEGEHIGKIMLDIA